MTLTPADRERFDAIWAAHERRKGQQPADANHLPPEVVDKLDTSIARLRRQEDAVASRPVPPRRGRVDFTRASAVTVRDLDTDAELGTHPAYNPYQQARVVKGRPPNLPRGEE